MDWNAFWNHSPQVRDKDFCRQVGRTFRGISCSARDIDKLVAHLLDLLEPSQEKTLLDVGCGQGMVTSRLAPHFARVTAVDFSEPLIDAARAHFGRPNIDYCMGDAAELDVTGGPFDCVLASAVIQYLDPDQANRMLQRLSKFVKPGGRVVLGEVPDRDRLWNFYSGLEGKVRYYFDLARGRPIIGTWWCPSQLLEMATSAGFSLAIHYQDHDSPNHYFRYDAVLEMRSPFNPARSRIA